MRSLKINRLLPIYRSILLLKFGVDIQSQTKVSPETKKIQYGRQVAILKVTSLTINRLLPIYISIVPLKFGVDIQSQTKVRVLVLSCPVLGMSPEGAPRQGVERAPRAWAPPADS